MLFHSLRKLNRLRTHLSGSLTTLYWRIFMAKMGKEVMIYPGSTYASARDIKIGHHVFIHTGGHFYTAGSKITIGDYVLIGRNCTMLAANRDYTQWEEPMYFNSSYIKKPITIKDDVWIGERAMLTAGVTIGRGVVIAAGSIVTRDVPDYAVVAGIPAKIVKFRFDKETQKKAKRIDLAKFAHLTKERKI